jgi:acyl-CoA reductase-like NAD-dependent aldehyde dehydrogenase
MADEQRESAGHEDEAEHSVCLDRRAAEDVETGEEELDDDAEEVEDSQALEEHSRLRHAGILPRMAVVAEREYGLFINGALVEPASGELRELVEPATGAPLAKAAMAGEADVDRAVEAARTALEGPWGKTPPNERSRLLHSLADLVHEHRKELAEVEVRNIGKAISSVKAELAQGVENLRFYASAIASIAGRSNPLGGSLLSYTLREPVGVCAQVVPWNYPFMLATWKVAPALAAGCAVVLKPDPATPLSALRLAELAAEVGFPAGVVNVVPGDGPTTGAFLVAHPGVDKVAFTSPPAR